MSSRSRHLTVALMAVAAGALLIFADFQNSRPRVVLVDAAASDTPDTPIVNRESSTEELWNYRYYVTPDPAQQRLLQRQGWSVWELVAFDLNIPLAGLLEANGLSDLAPLKTGTFIVVPLPRRHSWEACASFYGLDDGFDGKMQADGTIFHASDISVAMKELPKGSLLSVEFLETGVVVKKVPVRDSGPYYGRCARWPGLPRAADLSWGLMLKGFQGDASAAEKAGLGRVRITVEAIPPSYRVEGDN